jgi:beta-N-acetylhexosaminidase
VGEAGLVGDHHELGAVTDAAFNGLIISDDLDAPSTTHGRSLVDTIAARSGDDHAFGQAVARAAEQVRETAEAAKRV